MATGDLIGASIESVAKNNGWVLKLTFESMSTGGTIDSGLDSNHDPSGATITLHLTTEAYNTTPSLTTDTIDIYGTEDINVGALRKVDPDDATPEINASGSDVEILVPLANYVYDDDTSITVDVDAGYYNDGSNDNNSASGYSVTNNSTLDYPVVVGGWAVAHAQVVNDDFLVEFVATHGFAENGKPVAACVITATDEHSNSDSHVVTDLTISSNADFSDYSSVLVYAATIDVSGMTDGDKITINAKGYPWRGDAGSILNTGDAVNTFPCGGYVDLVFRLDKSNNHGHTCVSSGGNDGTGTVYSSQSAAEAGNHFLTIAAALTALQTYHNSGAGHNDAGGGTIYLDEQTHTLNSSNGGTLTEWVTITRQSGTSKSNVICNPAAGNAQFPTYCKFDGITVNTSYYWRAYTTDCMWYNDCDLTFSGSLSIWQMPYGVLSNCTGSMASNELKSYSTSKTEWGLVRACQFDDLERGHLYVAIGNFNVGMEDRGSSSGNALNERAFYGFNDCKPTSTNPQFVIADTTGDDYSDGYACVQSLHVRCTNQTQPVIRGSGDGSVTTVNNAIYQHVTLAGGRANLHYNDNLSGGPYAQTNIFVQNCIISSENNKDDTHNDNASATGCWCMGYHVGSYGCHVRTSQDDVWFGEFPGGLYMRKGTSATPLEPEYINDQSYDGGDTVGAGDYRLDSDSPCKAITPVLIFNYDLNGVARNISGAAGAYEYVEPVSGNSNYYYQNQMGGVQ